MKYLFEKKCPWNEEPCARAALIARLDILQFLHENGCPWNEITAQYACLAGSLECLQYAHENKCPWDEIAAECAGTGNFQGLPAQAVELMMRGIPRNAEKNRPKCLKYLVDNGCPGAQQYAHLLDSD